jgi:hypothetical protein
VRIRLALALTLDLHRDPPPTPDGDQDTGAPDVDQTGSVDLDRRHTPDTTGFGLGFQPRDVEA